MERCSGRGRALSRRMANRARSPLMVQARTGRSSAARLFTIRNKPALRFASLNRCKGEGALSFHLNGVSRFREQTRVARFGSAFDKSGPWTATHSVHALLEFRSTDKLLSSLKI